MTTVRIRAAPFAMGGDGSAQMRKRLIEVFEVRTLHVCDKNKSPAPAVTGNRTAQSDQQNKKTRRMA